MSSTPDRPQFTVFTPTFNRAHTLPRVYESLKAQSFRDFEWLIVDDGSSDNTKDLVEGWIRDARISIRYLIQQNQGKHFAFNHGVREARGEFFLTLDSDDEMLRDALQKLEIGWLSIPSQKRAGFSGVTGLCVRADGSVVGDRFPFEATDSNCLEMLYRYRIQGEKFGFQRTDVLKEFPFPEEKNFVAEGIVWGAIGRRYQTRYINEALRIYHTGADQVTKTSAIKMAPGLAAWHKFTLNHDLDWFRFSPKDFLKSAAHYIRFSHHIGKPFFSALSELQNSFAKFLCVVSAPLGYGLLLRDKILSAKPK